MLKIKLSTLISGLTFMALLVACSNPPPPAPPPPKAPEKAPLPKPPEVTEGVDKIEQLERLDPSYDPGLSPESFEQKTPVKGQERG